MNIGNNLNFRQYEIQNAISQNLAAAPASPKKGQFYFDTNLNQFGIYNGNAWIYVSTGIDNAVTKSANATATNILQVSAGTDKSLQDFTSAGGIIKVSATGVVSIATANTDYITASGFVTFTNKTIDAASNTINNLTVSNFAANVIDTDISMAANSDSRIASQKAVKAYISSIAANLSAAPKGSLDCSTNPNYPAASPGDKYRISVAGLIGGTNGVSVQQGDIIECYVATAAGNHATVGSNWSIIQGNAEQATTSVLGLVSLATSSETSAKASTTKVVTPASLAAFTQKVVATIGDNSATTIVVTDNLNTTDKIAICRDAVNNEQVLVDTIYAANTTTFAFGSAPALNSYKVVIIG